MSRPFDFSQMPSDGIVILPALPPDPVAGEALVVNTIGPDGRVQLTFASGGGGGSGTGTTVTVSDTPPVDPDPGALWFDSVNAQLFLRYDDGNSVQWVVANTVGPATSGGETTGVVSFNTRTGPVTLTQADVTTVLPPADTAPAMDGTAAAGTGITWSRQDHRHPTDTSRYAASNPSDYQTSAQVAAAVAPAQNNVGRNLLHNGLFNVAQRGVGPFNATGAQVTYAADRWIVQSGVAGDTMGMTLNPLTDANRTQIGDEAATTMASLTFIGTAAAGSICRTSQKIENVRRLAGKTVIVSFYASGNVANKLGVSIDQYFGAGGSPSASVSGAGQAVTMSAAAWTRHSVTLAIPSISGKTVGTTGGDCTILNIWGSAGSTYSGPSGGVGNQATWYANIWGVQLEIAAAGQTQPSPLEKPDPQVDLANCQRFYQIGRCSVTAYAGAGALTGDLAYFRTWMRAAPTVTLGLVGADTNVTGAGAPDVLHPTSFRFYVQATVAGNVQATRDFTASAEL